MGGVQKVERGRKESKIQKRKQQTNKQILPIGDSEEKEEEGSSSDSHVLSMSCG